MKYRIGIGIGSFDLDPTTYADTIAAIGESGFDSLWVSDVLTAPGPDVLMAMSWAAQLQPKMKVGTTMLLPGRNPVRLAKSLATLDVLTGGRLLVTFINGLTRSPEREAIGVPVGERGREIERTLPLLRRWWAGETVDGITVSPRPVQQPLECWLGGIAPAALERCGRFGDGWLTAMCTPEEARAGRRAIEQVAESAGREIDPEHFGVSIGYSRTPLDDAQLAAIAGRTRGRGVDPVSMVPVGLPALHQRLVEFMEAGLSKFVLRPMPSARVDASAAESASAAVTWREELQELAGVVGSLQS